MIKINEDYVISLDPMNYVLKQKIIRTKKDTGEKVKDYKVIGYYGTVKEILYGIRKNIQFEHLKKAKINLKDLASEIEKLDKKFMKDLDKLESILKVKYEPGK